MMLRRLALAAAVLMLIVPLVAQIRQDGRWAVTMEMSMPGMTMPAMSAETCLTPEDVKNPQSLMPPGRGNPGNCSVSDYKQSGNTVTWSMKCEGQNAMTGTGEMTYTGDTYTGTMNMNAAGRSMVMKMNGKRLGDCTKP